MKKIVLFLSMFFLAASPLYWVCGTVIPGDFFITGDSFKTGDYLLGENENKEHTYFSADNVRHKVVFRTLFESYSEMGGVCPAKDRMDNFTALEAKELFSGLTWVDSSIFTEQYFGMRKDENPNAKIHNFIASEYLLPKDNINRNHYFKELASLRYLNVEIIKSTYVAAKKILEFIKQDDVILVFGNTPYYIGRALERLARKTKTCKIIYFPFSGAPDIAQFKGRGSSYLHNIVTKQRLAHLKKRISQLPDLSKNRRLFIMDIINSGGGPAFFIDVLIRFYLNEKGFIPDINIISLNDQNHSFLFNDNDQSKMYFPKAPLRNILETGGKPFLFVIDHYPVPVDAIEKLDVDDSKEVRIMPLCYPIFWNKEYDDFSDIDVREKRNPDIQYLHEYFDAQIEKLLSLENKY